MRRLVARAKEESMQLILRRDQRQGMMKVVFSLQVRTELSEDEKAAILKYKLADTMLYEKVHIPHVGGASLLGAATWLAGKALNISLKVKDLAYGKTIECKDIVEMLAVEDQVKEAGKTFNAILTAAMRFGGDEVIDFAA